MEIYKKIKKNPINKNIGANLFGVIISLMNQILMVPFFLNSWGIEKYGDWIILTSISSFLTITDIGLNSVTANRYAIKYTEGEEDECNRLLINNYLFLTILTSFLIFISLIYLVYGDINNDFDIRTTDTKTARIVLFMLEAKIFIFMFSTIPNAVYRAVSLFSKAMFLDNLVRLGETIFLLIGVIFSLDLKLIATILLLPNLLILIFKNYDAKRYIKYTISLKNIDIPLLKITVLPSLGFLTFPVSNAIIQQGFTLVINRFMGAGTMVLFNTTRTLVNFIKQLTNVIAMAVWPELSIAFGKRDFKRMQKIHYYSFTLSTLLTFAASIFVICFGKVIYNIWTTNQIIFNSYLMLSFLIVLVVNNGWYTSSMSLMATNNHSKLGIFYFILAILSTGIVYLVIDTWHKIELVPFCLLFIDSILSVWVLKQVLNLTQDNFGNFLSGIKDQVVSVLKIRYKR